MKTQKFCVQGKHTDTGTNPVPIEFMAQLAKRD